MGTTAEHTSPLDAYGLGDFPFALAVAALFAIVLCRAQGTYWIGRAIAAGVTTRPWARRLVSGETAERGIALLHRWGPFAVTLSFLTVGAQTVINAAAGLVRMPWVRYTLFMVPGCLAWAFLYATIGLAAFLALAAAAAGSPLGVAVIVVAAALVAFLVWRTRRRRPTARVDAPAVDGGTPSH